MNFKLILRLVAIQGLALCFLQASCVPSENTFDTLARSLSEQLRSTGGEYLSPRIIVADLPVDGSQLTALSSAAADELSKALGQRLGQIAIVSRKALHDTLHVDLLSPNDLEDFSIANWIFGSVGANVYLRGHIAMSSDNVRISAQLIRLADYKILADASVTAVLNQDWRIWATQPLDWPQPSDVAVPCTVRGQIDAFKIRDVTMPKCAHCPLPSYPKAGRRDKITNVSVKVTAIIDAGGRPVSLHVIRGAGHGFDEQTTDAIQKWRFVPARKDGNPVAVCTVIETTFRLF